MRLGLKLSRIPDLSADRKRVLTKTADRIRNLAAYTAVALARSPKRVKSREPAAGRRASNSNYFSIETKLFAAVDGELQEQPQTIREYLRERKRRNRKKGAEPQTVISDLPPETTILRKGGKPGGPPKSWESKSWVTSYFISQKQDGVFADSGKKKFVNNWQIREAGTLEQHIFLNPLHGGGNEEFLKLLEHGGTMISSPYIKGYAVFTRRRKGKASTVRFEPVYSTGKNVRVSPRPFVEKALERVRQAKLKKERF